MKLVSVKPRIKDHQLFYHKILLGRIYDRPRFEVFQNITEFHHNRFNNITYLGIYSELDEKYNEVHW